MTAGIAVALALGAWPAVAQLEGLFQQAMRAGGLAASAPARVVAVVTEGGGGLPVGRELHVGDRFDVGRGEVAVTYLDPCAVERISGGSVTIGPFSSDVAGGSVTDAGGSCHGGGVGLGAGVPGGGTTTGEPDEAGVVVVRNFMIIGPRPPVRTVPNGDGFLFDWPGGRGLLTVWQVADDGMTLMWEDLGRGTGVFYPSAAPKFVVGPVYAVLQDGKYVFFRLSQTPTHEIAKITIGGRTGGSSGGSSGESQGPGGSPQSPPGGSPDGGDGGDGNSDGEGGETG
jgi:hypothetical protein